MNTLARNDKGLNFTEFLVFAFVAMVVWPVIGSAASFSLFDKPSDAVLLFGGLIGILLLPIYAIFPVNETVFGIAVAAIWIVTWFGCSLWFATATGKRRTQWIALIVLSSISLCQTALGVLMILGKSV
jgi:hypothetical protein